MTTQKSTKEGYKNMKSCINLTLKMFQSQIQANITDIGY